MLTIQECLSRSTLCVLSFLEQHLPAIGGELWWQKSVINKLSEQQTKLAEQKQFSALSDFDLAALLNLLERNWRVITDSTSGFDYRRGLNLIIELKNIRNHYAHEPSSGTELDQQMRDVDSITRLLKILGADSALVGQIEALHRDLMMRMLGRETGQIATGEQNTSDQDESGDEDESELSTLEQDMDDPQKGVPVHWLKAGTILEQGVLKKCVLPHM